ncbi:MAG TPA: hypothetical protein VK488_01640 [Gaiellaceae bacterium]|nr:hypothetical protein [Gaiellaceae bacterium]
MVAEAGAVGVDKPCPYRVRYAELNAEELRSFRDQCSVLAGELQPEPSRVIAAFDRLAPTLGLSREWRRRENIVGPVSLEAQGVGKRPRRARRDGSLLMMRF